LTKSWKKAKLKAQHVKKTLRIKDAGLEELGYERRALGPPNDTAVAGALLLWGCEACSRVRMKFKSGYKFLKGG
jgi:hypothetical protein